VRPVLPRGGGGGVVITSRNPVWRRDATVLPVEVLDRGEAVAFLLERTGQADATAAGQLAEALGDLPLALEQAGAYVDEQGITLAAYTRQLRTRAPELFAAGQPPDYQNTVATTWTVSFQVVEQASPVTADLLRLCAFLGSDAIPSSLFGPGADLLPEPLGRVASDPDQLAMAVAPARRYALMKVVNSTLSMHRLVQVVVRHQLNPEQQQRWATTALHLVRSAFPAEHTNPEAWPVYARLLPHAQAVTNDTDVPEIDHKVTSWLLNEAGRYLWQRADYQQARRLLERALALRQAHMGPNHPDTATSVSDLANVLRAEGDLAGARMLHQRALAIREICLGSDHPDTATSLNNVANILYNQGDLDGARALHERSLAIREACLEPDHPETGWSLNNLAVVLHAQGDLDGARNLHERALAIRETRLVARQS
jgi:tetratricopeptide (TPR) repeat protein